MCPRQTANISRLVDAYSPYDRTTQVPDGSPLTMADGFSRFRRGCHARSSTRVQEAKPVFVRLFKGCGWPKRIRTDHGVPFATHTRARLAQRSAWWVRRGLLPACIEPGKPQPNGRHERRHRTLNADTTSPPANTCRAQPDTCDRFRQACNFERPHEALARQTPASRDASSPPQWPHTLPPLEDPDRFEVRYVRANRGIRWHRQWVNVSIGCAGESVGLEEIDKGVWHVYVGPLTRGRRLERQMRLEDASGRLTRHR
jgi:putative transposase